VAEAEKPSDLPEMHKVESMVVDRVFSNRKVVKMSLFSLGLFGSPSMEEDICINMIKKRDRDAPNESMSLGFDDVSEGKTIKRQIQIDSLWQSIDASDYENYLKLLNDWYVSHHRLPRKKTELTLAGFDAEIVQKFDEKQFRKEMLALTIKLYLECYDHSAFDESFIKYIENKYYTKDGVINKVSSFVKQLF
jgi:hypothetical protein